MRSDGKDAGGGGEAERKKERATHGTEKIDEQRLECARKVCGQRKKGAIECQIKIMPLDILRRYGRS